MTRFPDVHGRCPACGSTLLFLGAGGYVTCSLSDCPDPTAANELLAPPRPRMPNVDAMAEEMADLAAERERRTTRGRRRS